MGQKKFTLKLVKRNLSSRNVFVINESDLTFSIPVDALRINGFVMPQSKEENKIKIICI